MDNNSNLYNKTRRSFVYIYLCIFMYYLFIIYVYIYICVLPKANQTA